MSHDGVGPSDRHPDLTQVLLSVPPSEESGRVDQRVEALADYISHTMEMGASIEETEREIPGQAPQRTGTSWRP
ncbi:hypothetical protein [Streptomyces sp. Inha503]|uniref:hypothetical protein n=1 Tax=Streptomyces sp. Inha503 TaxID=3383314 RepID=UPI0039A205A5